MAGPSTATPPPRTEASGLPPAFGFRHWLHEGPGFAVSRILSDLLMLTAALFLARELTPESENDFFVFDFCGNLEYFSQDLPGVEGSAQKSLTQLIFESRLGLVAQLDTTKAPR